MWEELITYDKHLFLFLNGLGNEKWDEFWLLMTNKLGFINLLVYLLLLFLTYRFVGLKHTFFAILTVIIMIAATDQLANLFKDGVQRLRPCYDPQVAEAMRLVKKSCGGKFGYFSAHAANHFAVALFFALLLKSRWRYIGVLLIVWASLVAYSRLYIGVHFPLDIISGTAIGLLLSILFYKFYLYLAVRYS